MLARRNSAKPALLRERSGTRGRCAVGRAIPSIPGGPVSRPRPPRAHAAGTRLTTLALLLAALLALAAGPALADKPEHAPGPGAPYRAAVLGDHPISYWRLGEQAGATIAADELHHHPGYYGGSPTLGVAHPVGGDADTAIDLDGLQTQPFGQFVHVSDNGHLAFPGRAAFTLEAWVRPRGFNGVTRRIYSKEGPDGGYLLGIQQGGVVFSRYAHGQWSTLLTGVAASRWSHVMATYDGTTMQVYVDGSLSASRPSLLSLPAARSDLSIGAKQSRWRFYAGGLDELAIYGRALSGERAMAHTRVGSDSP